MFAIYPDIMVGSLGILSLSPFVATTWRRRTAATNTLLLTQAEAATLPTLFRGDSTPGDAKQPCSLRTTFEPDSLRKGEGTATAIVAVTLHL
jgi:hypothetical protein